VTLHTNMEHHNLKFIYWYAAGLQHKLFELEHFMFTNKVDIALVCETHLNKNIKLHLPGFKIYRSDRDGTKGGSVAIIVRNIITHQIKGQQSVTLVATKRH
jgi:hypothetical protein